MTIFGRVWIPEKPREGFSGNTLRHTMTTISCPIRWELSLTEVILYWNNLTSTDIKIWTKIFIQSLGGSPRMNNVPSTTHSPVRHPLCLALRPSLPLLLPVQRWEKEEVEGDMFSEIVKNNLNDWFASVRSGFESRILARRPKADLIFSENTKKMLSWY